MLAQAAAVCRTPNYWVATIISVIASVISSAATWATTERFVPVLMPIENIQHKGYCEREAVGFDNITCGFICEAAVVSAVLSQPNPVVAWPGLHDGRDNLDVNPLTATNPRIGVSIDDVEGNWQRPKITIEILGASEPQMVPTTLVRTKAALVFALRNAFARDTCVRATVEIKGLPDQAGAQGARLYEKTQSPYSPGSPLYQSLVKEIASKERCQVGRPLVAKVPALAANSRTVKCH